MHPLNEQVENKPFFEISNHNLVFSSLTESEDQAGWLIRVYNPNKFALDGKKIIKLEEKKMISLTDFVGNIIDNYGLEREISVESFKPGEIKTIRINK